MSGNVLASELSRRQPPRKIIGALGRLRREDAESLAPTVMRLLAHPEPDVRSEAISVVFVLWRLAEHRRIARQLFDTDRHESVRARAAYALAATGTEDTRREDVELFVRCLEDEHQTGEVRRAAYEALLLLFHRPQFPDALREFDPKTAVDWEWVEELRAL